MREMMKWLAVGALVVLLSACGGGGDTKGSTSGTGKAVAAKMISVDSAMKNEVSVLWLPSDSESDGEVTYEVHVSKDRVFVPSANTKKLETKEHEAVIGGLAPSTTYYVCIVTRTTSGDRKSSLVMEAQTASIDAILDAGIDIVVHKESEIVTTDTNSITTTKETKPGEYIVGDASHPYLRKVVSVQKENGKFLAQTEKTTLGKVFSSLEFTTAYKLEDVSQNTQSSSKMINNRKLSSFKWHSGSLLSSEFFGKNVMTHRLAKVTTNGEIIKESNEYYSVSVPEKITLNVGDKLDQSISIAYKGTKYHYNDYGLNDEKECTDIGGTYDYVGQNECLNIPVKICEVQYSVDDTYDLGSNNKPEVVKDGENYSIEWIPNDNNLDPEKGGKYTMDIDVKIGVGDCKGDNEDMAGTLSLEDIEFRVGNDIAGERMVFAKKKEYTFTTDDGKITFKNTLSASFVPSIVFSGKFVDKKVETATAKLHAEFDVQDIAKLTMSLEAEHTFTPEPIYTKRFVKVVMAGPVPVILSGQLKFMAVAEVESQASIEATLDNTVKWTLDYGLHYDGSTWSPVKDQKFTYRVKVGAKGSTETTMRIRLIPDFNIEVYELAAVHMLAEPYLYATVGVEGEISATIGSSQSGTDVNAQFTKMEAGAGMDLRLYAGAAWDTSIKSIKYPSDAHYAQIGGASFMNPKHRKILKEYYETTRSYKQFTVFDQTPIASIPKLSIDDPYYTMKAPSGISSRAIKIKADYKDIENPLYKYGIGKQYYVTFERWDDVEIFSGDAEVVSVGTEGEYWIVPKPNSEEIGVRLAGHSSMGFWARQTVETTLEVGADTDSIPAYWRGRYGLGSDAGADSDSDGYTDLAEYQAGTDPSDSSSHPADEQSPVFDSASAASVHENQTAAITLHATDTGVVTYSISGADAGSFDLDADTGVVTFKNAPDYESGKTSYTFTATATDEVGNTATLNVTITILDVDETVPDTTPPVITITGDNLVTLHVGDSYTDAGATATDAVDGSVAVTVITDTVDTATVGEYAIVYRAVDAAGNESNATRVVKVIEGTNTPPTANATASPTTITVGEVVSFDGTGSSDSDGSIVQYVWKDGSTLLSTQSSFTEDNLSVGSHTITLTVTDDDNATASDSVTITVNSASAQTTQLKKTGQTKSYDENGTEVTDNSIKDDGYYQKGVTPNYTRNDTAEVVTDHITGLEWQDDADVSTVTKPWLTQTNYDICTGQNGQTQDMSKCTDTSGDTAATYCSSLSLGGFTDWRLPTIDELMYIADRSKANPAIDTSYFENVVSNGYWSSTTVVGSEYCAWLVYFSYGYDYWDLKSNSGYVRCVRDGQ